MKHGGIPGYRDQAEFTGLASEGNQLFMDQPVKLTHDSTGRWLDRRELHGKKNPLAYSVGRIKSETGLNERQIDRIIAEIKKKGK